jgi:hypothetical protein
LNMHFFRYVRSNSGRFESIKVQVKLMFLMFIGPCIVVIVEE